MATRSAIIEKRADGTCRGIYCHFDGYLSHHGPILRDHYRDPAKVSRLIDLGDISSLAREVDPPAGVPHSYGDAADGVTVAYMRDRGETNCEARIGTELELADSIGHDGHVYVFDGVSWTHNGKPIPEGDCNGTEAA